MRNCVVIIDGVELEVPSVDPDIVIGGNCGGDMELDAFPTLTCREGDNRGSSQDSRLRSAGADRLVRRDWVVNASRPSGGDWQPLVNVIVIAIATVGAVVVSEESAS